MPQEILELLYPLPYSELIRANAERWKIDGLLLAALMREESRFDPQALSSASASGPGLSTISVPRWSASKRSVATGEKRPPASGPISNCCARASEPGDGEDPNSHPQLPSWRTATAMRTRALTRRSGGDRGFYGADVRAER